MTLHYKVQQNLSHASKPGPLGFWMLASIINAIHKPNFFRLVQLGALIYFCWKLMNF